MRLHPRVFSLIFLSLFFFVCGLMFTQSSQANPLRVTLLLEHKAKSTWSTQLQKGLMRAKRDFGIAPKIVVESDPDRQEFIFRECAKVSDLVLVASDAFHEILRDNARAFSNVRFGCIDAGIRGSNISSITFKDEQAAFLAGASAALFTEHTAVDTGKGKAIGWISGNDIPAMQSMYNGFLEGAKLAVPDIRVIHSIVGSFANPEKGAEEAKRLIHEGITVLVLAAGGSNPGIVREAKKAGIYLIGLDTDQKTLYPGHVLLSIVKDIDGAVYSLVKDCVQNTFKAKEIETYDLKNGVSITNPSDSLKQNSDLLTKIQRRNEELTQELLRGGIHLKSLRQRALCNCL